MTVKREMASRAVAEPKSVVRRAKALTIRSSPILLKALFFWSISLYASVSICLSVQRNCVRTVSHAPRNPGSTP